MLLSTMRRWQCAIVPLVLLAFGLLCYRSILNNPFTAEDFVQAWTTDLNMVLHQSFPGGGGYRPLMFLFWYLGNWTWGYHPGAYRFVIFVLHTVNSIFLFALVRRLTGHASAGIFAAGVFISLPTSAETVNWLSAASNAVTCTFGYLLALLSYLALRSQGRPTEGSQARWYALCILGLLIALFSSELGLTWPLAAFTLSYSKHRNKTVRNGWGRTTNRAVTAIARLLPDWAALRSEWLALRPLLVIEALFLVLRTAAVHGVGAYGPEVHLRAGRFLINDGWVYIQFFTLRLSSIPWVAQFFALVEQNYVMGLVGFLVVLVLLWFARWELLTMLILALPALNIPALHRGYLAGAGFGLVLATVLARFTAGALNFSEGMRIRTLARAGGAVVVGLGLVATQVSATWERNAAWTYGTHWGAEVVSTTVSLVPQPEDGTRFYFFNLPTVTDVYVFTWGLREAIQAQYGNRTLIAYQVSSTPNQRRVQAGIETTIEDIEREREHQQVFLVYEPENPPGEWSLSMVSQSEFINLVRQGNARQ